MKKLITLYVLSLFFIGCSSDDDNAGENGGLTITVNVTNVNDHNASISWTLEGNTTPVVFEIVLAGNTVREGYTGTTYNFTGLDESRTYNGVVFAVEQDGSQTFANFSFDTLLDVNEEGSVYLSNQEQINNFVFETVAQNLYINGTNITNLNGLSSLRSVGRLIIDNNNNLTSLNGLEQLQFNSNSGSRSITISNNPILSDISAISSMAPQTNDLRLINNPDLNTIENWNLPNNSLVLIDEMPISNLNFLEGVSDLRYLSINQCPNLNSLEGLNNLQNISNELSLSELAITNVSELSNISGELKILNLKYLDNLNNLNGFTGITFIDTIDILDCDALTNLDGFSGLNRIDTVSILKCDALTNVDGFQNCTDIGDNDENNVWSYIELSNNPLLENVDGFSGLINPIDSSNNYRFRIYHNSSLTDLCGFNGFCDEIFNSGNDYIISWGICCNGYNPNGQSVANGDCSI